MIHLEPQVGNPRPYMKKYLVALFAAASAVAAAEPAIDFTFRDSKVGYPTLKLSQGSPADGRQHASRPLMPAASNDVRYFPFSSSDLIAPASTRDQIIWDFRSRAQPPKSDLPRADQSLKRSFYVPLSSTDLLGPTSDRERIIREFNSRSQVRKQPDNAAEPAPTVVPPVQAPREL
jgi:hypothetical protein